MPLDVLNLIADFAALACLESEESELDQLKQLYTSLNQLRSVNHVFLQVVGPEERLQHMIRRLLNLCNLGKLEHKSYANFVVHKLSAYAFSGVKCAGCNMKFTVNEVEDALDCYDCLRCGGWFCGECWGDGSEERCEVCKSP